LFISVRYVSRVAAARAVSMPIRRGIRASLEQLGCAMIYGSYNVTPPVPCG